VDCVRSPQSLLEELGPSRIRCAAIDLKTTRATLPPQEGLDLLARIHEFDTRLPVIVMTAWGNIDLAVESIKRGARDFIQKPGKTNGYSRLISVHAELRPGTAARTPVGTGKRLLRAEGMRSLWPARPRCEGCWN